MPDNETNNNSLVPIHNTGLIKAGNIIKITNKIIFNGIEELFNEAFCLLNHLPIINISDSELKSKYNIDINDSP